MLYSFYLITLFLSVVSSIDSNNTTVSLKDCALKNPDTSVSGIKIRDPESTRLVLGKHTMLEGDSTHHFYSKNRGQVLSLTVHPGEYRSQVSIFKVRYAGKYKPKYHLTKLDRFETEKGIRLGVSKEYVIIRLGKCYSTIHEKKGEIISYRLESPKDSKTKLLERQNMPIYYSIYNFKKGKLVTFEFGFEYP